uniref:Uncharacterized protein n=1 Tax=Arundo donax TaxID=35708 RepID=A0A0A8ZBF4_ARUDO
MQFLSCCFNLSASLIPWLLPNLSA